MRLYLFVVEQKVEIASLEKRHEEMQLKFDEQKDLAANFKSMSVQLHLHLLNERE